MRKTYLAAGFTITVIIIASIAITLRDNTELVPLENSLASCRPNVALNLTIPQELKEGEPLEIIAEVTSEELMTLLEIHVNISGAMEIFEIGASTIDQGQELTLNLTIGTAVDSMGSFLPLKEGKYTVQSLTLITFSCLKIEKLVHQVSYSFDVSGHETEDRMETIQWNEISSNATYQVSGGNFIFPAQMENNQILVNATINLAGITQIFYEMQGVEVEADINGTLYFTETSLTYDDKLLVPHLNGNSTITLLITTNTTTGGSFSLSAPTRRIVIHTGIVEDGWSDTFQPTKFYLSQVSPFFEETFNITFTPSFIVQYTYSGTHNLIPFLERASTYAAEYVGLSSWILAPVNSTLNRGVNLLLLMTNKTMDHFGIVVGDQNERYGIATHAGGSEFAGGQRLASSWGDNLIQHEVSHVFGADDHYSGEEPSVMTKPTNAQEVLQDIIRGKLWLTLHNWLLVDLVIMTLSIYSLFG